MKPLSIRLGMTAIAAAALVPSVADACRLPAYTLALIHDAVPERIPLQAVVLEVSFAETDRATRSEFNVPVRIHRVVHGSVDRDSALVRVRRRTSCHYPFANGRSGLLVGRAREIDGELVIDPIYVSRGNGFRLR